MEQIADIKKIIRGEITLIAKPTCSICGEYLKSVDDEINRACWQKFYDEGIIMPISPPSQAWVEIDGIAFHSKCIVKRTIDDKALGE